jgi:glutamate decarboxylase
MPLHQLDADRNILGVDIYASDLSTRALPRNKLPEDSVHPHVAVALVHDPLLLDGNARLNLATEAK